MTRALKALQLCVLSLAILSAYALAASTRNAPVVSAQDSPSSPYLSSPSTDSAPDHDDIGSNMHSLFISILMIVVSEIGDKTFLIAALMAMRHQRWLVFSAAVLLLALMLILLGVVGHAVPSLLSRRLTQACAAVLFLVFGVRLLREGLAMSKGLGVDEEMAEVEDEIIVVEKSSANDVEMGRVQFTPQSSIVSEVKNLFSLVLSPIWIQVFVMTFLGEWGDRSQVATIAMAAGSDYWYVILGAIIGHSFCTAAACIGGKLLAQKISMRNVTLGGAAAFFVFLVMYAYASYYDIE